MLASQEPVKSYKRSERFSHCPVSDLRVLLYGPPVLGSSLILLPLVEEETSSPVAFIEVLASEKTVALNESNPVTPTTSKTIKITIDRAQRSFVRDELASRFFEQQIRRSDLVLEPVLEVDE